MNKTKFEQDLNALLVPEAYMKRALLKGIIFDYGIS
jgi:hypothetical protein